MAAGQIAARKEKDLKVSKFIEKLKPYSDFELKATVHLEVMEEELQKRIYGYPHDNYEIELDIDDVGYSDNILLIGASVKE